MTILFVAAICVLSVLFPSFGKFAMAFIFFPVFTLFWGCLIWVAWNIFTGLGALSMDGFMTSMMWGCLPGIWMTMTMSG